MGHIMSLKNMWGFPGGSVLKTPHANAKDTRDSGLIPGSGRSPGRGNVNSSSILAGEITCLEEPSGLLSMGCKESDTTEHTAHRSNSLES